MKFLATLLFVSSIIVAGDLPAYLNYDFDASKKNQDQLYRYIVSGNGPQIYVPEDLAPWDGTIDKGLNVTKSADGVELMRITNDGTAQTETWMAVNPTNPLNIVATANDFSATNFGSRYSMVSHWSKDGGKTWTRIVTDNFYESFLFTRPQSGGLTIFDPCITFTDNGDLVYLFGYAQTPSNDGPGENGIFAVISYDGGESWEQFDGLEDMSIVTWVNGGLQDRYSIAADWWSEEYKGNVYVAWKDFDTYNGIRVAGTNKDSREYKDWAPLGGSEVYNTLPGTQSPVPAVDKNGIVWLTFRRTISTDRTEAPLYYSTDAGETFNIHSLPISNFNIGAPSSELELFERVNMPDKNGMRISTNPLIAIDNSDGPYAGTIYVVQPGKENSVEGDYRIYVAYQRNASPESKDDPWTQVRIDNNILGNDMFHPNISVDPVTGYVHVIYYSSQNDPTNEGLDVYYAYSYDGGQTWKHKRLTNELSYVRTSNQGHGNRYWGDYTSIVSYDNHIYPLWWNQLNKNQFNSNELFTAKLRTYPDKPAVLETTYDNGVIISWDGIYDGLGEVIDEYDVKLFKSGQEVATIAKDQNSWTDTEASLGETINYGIQVISKDKRGAGEIHNFEFIVGGALETKAPSNLRAMSIEGGLEISFTTPTDAVDDSSIDNLGEINLYNGDQLLETVDISSVNPGDNFTFTYSADNFTFFNDLYVTSTRNRDGESAESQRSNSIIAFSGPAYETVNLDFDNEVPAFVSNEGWDITSQVALSGANSITDSPDGNYGNRDTNSIIFMPFIYDGQNQFLNLQLIANVDPTDEFSIELSNDNGTWWRKVAITNSDFVPQWTGDLETSDWFMWGVPLEESNFEVGDNIYVRLTLQSNNFLRTADGVYVDDIQVNNVLSVENQNTFVNQSISPNPAMDNASIYFEQSYSGNINIELYNSTGNFVKTITQRQVLAGPVEENFSVEDLSSGLYYVRVSSNNSNFVLPLNVIK